MFKPHEPLKTLSTIARILHRSDPAENPLAHIVGMVREQMQVDVASLYLLQGKTLILVATDGLHSSAVGKVRMKVSEGLTGLAVEELQPIFVKEASLHERFKYFPETGEEKFHSFAALPLFDREKIVGVLAIQHATPRDFTFNEIELLKLIAFQLGPVIQNLVTLEILQTEDSSENVPRHLIGKSASTGLSIGPACILRGTYARWIPSFDQKNEKIHPRKEWIKLEKALRKASNELLKLEKKLFKTLSRAESDIFFSHRMILEDGHFLAKLRGEIEGRRNASQAVYQVIQEYLSFFETVEDPHLQEKKVDLEDLRERLLRLLSPSLRKKSSLLNGILVADQIGPSDVVHLDPTQIVGILTSHGGITSHATILARSLGIPMVTGIPNLLSQIRPGDLLILDGNRGEVFLNPEKTVLKEYEKIQEQYAGNLVHLQKLASKPAVTSDGRRIQLKANLGFGTDLQKLSYYGAEGVGLYRTEFPYLIRKELPSEEEQFELYRKVLEEACGLPVTFRILDVGGDKPVEALRPYIGARREENPVLGFRSIRLTLKHPRILRDQFTALLRASLFGPIQILIPMISSVEELRVVKGIYAESQRLLSDQQIPFDPKIPFGIMIEVPSAVPLAPFLIREVDFFSIGTNDLIQYTLAVDRDNERVASLFEPLNPAILHAIAYLAKVGADFNKPVGICGEMASDPFLTPFFVGVGIAELSMVPSQIPQVKQLIRSLDAGLLSREVKGVLSLATAQEVREKMTSWSSLQP